MSDRSKPRLSAERAFELISEIDASDRQQARLAIAGGVRKAQDGWIAAHVIAEALVLELISVTGADIAAHLRALAEMLEAEAGVH